ncbi:MAG: AMIN domain-containing protein [Elusimicrobiota bacterium]
MIKVQRPVYFILLIATILGLGFSGIVLSENTDTAAVSEPVVDLISASVDNTDAAKPQLILNLSKTTKCSIFHIYNPPQLVIDLSNTVNKWEQKELTVNSGFIKGVRSSQYRTDPPAVTRVVIDLKQAVKYEAFRQDKNNRIVVNLTAVDVKTKPVSNNSNVNTTKKKVKADITDVLLSNKQPVDLNFVDADIRDILRLLSEKTGINIIYGDDVKGNVSVSLDNVPFEEAMRTILDLKGLVAKSIGGNIIRVMTPEVLSQERSRAVTYTRIYSINYAKSSDLEVQLNAIRNAEGRKGSISTDLRTNSLIITDTEEGLEASEKIIVQLDIKPYQVQIEAKLVEIVLSENKNLGINWAATQTNTSGSDSQTGGINVSLPVPALGSISFGVVSNTLNLNAQLQVLMADSKTRILSNPRISTVNNTMASIIVGKKVPYSSIKVTANNQSTQSTEFLDVGIKLEVTPTINVDKRISMKVRPEVSLVSEFRPEGPVVATREANTTVIVKDGETVVIAGLIDDSDIEAAAKIPMLGDLPVLGAFFKRNQNTKERTELLIMLTPRIVEY